MTPRVSVVIPTYRRPDLLAKCLERLLAQQFPADEFEIIVADDGPDASTRQLVESLQQSNRPRITYVPVTATQGPAGARNAGWRMAAAEIIAFTDDDCLPDPHWLAAGVQALENADAATGKTIVPLPERPTDFERNVGGLATAEFITANCFVRREALAAVGGFDERFTLAWREDSDLQFALLSHGYRIAKAEDAVVIHPARPAPWGVSLKQQRQGLFDPLLYRKHPQLYQERVPPLPRSYYAAVAAVLTLLVSLLLGQIWLAAAALLVWLVLIARLTLRRLSGTSLAPAHVLEMVVTSAAIPFLSIYWRLVGNWQYRVWLV
jgi:glycosyltransferase involved in cell wall biosynthesis